MAPDCGPIDNGYINPKLEPVADVVADVPSAGPKCAASTNNRDPASTVSKMLSFIDPPTPSSCFIDAASVVRANAASVAV